MQQCFLMDFPVILVPGKDEALSSVKIFLPELRGHFSTCPTRDHKSVFLVCIFVAVVSTDDYQHLATLDNKMNQLI